jgi:alkylated DNA repair dioxygenase AlkB
MIAGLQYVPGYVAGAEHDALMATVAALDWQEAGGRRIQFYGHWYHHARGGVYRVGDLPEWAAALTARLRDDGLMPYLADQLIVTEYEPGEGIRPHIDAPMFADVIVGVTLGSSCVMEFLRPGHATEAVLLEPCSAVVFSGDARHEWQHAIPARTADDWHGRRLPRSRRVSLTFRKMLDTTQPAFSQVAR